LQTQFLRLAEGTLAYTDYGGQGEPALMLPGVLALRSEYRVLGPALAQAGYHAVAADLRGQGESSANWPSYDVPAIGRDILALIEHLGGSGHVIATSFAASPAVWAAVERPRPGGSRVRSLTLIGASVRDAELNPFVQAIFWFMLNNPWRVQTWNAFYASLYPAAKPADFAAYRQSLVANLREPGRFDAGKAMTLTPRGPATERLSRVTVPTLVIMGTKDPDFSDAVAEANYIAGQTRGQLVLIEGGGHYPQTELPEQTLPVILDFLGRTKQTPS
jgi:pimeloyl-ACP methyl ester carboxylesterase